MDSNEINKILGAVIGSVLVFILLGFFSGQVFHSPKPHGEEPTLAFALDTGEEEDASDGEPAPEVSLAALAMDADPDAGAKVFNQCKACHKLEDGANGIGPHLWNVVGREIAAVGAYQYSDALAGKDGVWDVTALSGFLENPQGWAPGTKMGYGGLDDPEDRVDLIAYLNQSGDAPVDLVESAGGLEEEAAAAPADEATATDAAGAESETAATEEPAAEETAATDEPATEETAATEEPAAEETAATEESASGDGEMAMATPEPEEAATEEVATEEPATEDAAAEEPVAEEEPAAAEAPAPAGPYAELLANASAENGEKVFRECKTCHVIEAGRNRVGPHLYGVVGRDIASVEKYRFSPALSELEGDWTLARLDGFLADPLDWAPGTKMGYVGLEDPQDRIDVITYMNEASGSPVELAAGAPAAPAAETEATDEAPAETGTETAAAPAAEETSEPEAAEAPADTAEAPADAGTPAPADDTAMAEEEPAAEEPAEMAAAPADEPAQSEEPAEMAAAPADEPAQPEEAPAAADSGEGTEVAAAGPYADLIAAADPEAGEKVYRTCRACHQVKDGRNGVGPHLYDVVGREIAAVDGFRYSDALSGKDGVWTVENLMPWLEDPRNWAPGTKMVYPGVKDAQDRMNLIAYLNEIGGTPEPLK